MKKLYPEESVQAIADAIRTKTGKTDKMTVGEMSEEIEGIDLDLWITSEGVKQISSLRTNIRSQFCCGIMTELEEVDIPYLTFLSIGYTFNYCTKLKKLNLPSLTTVQEYFVSNSGLEELILPSLTSNGSFLTFQSKVKKCVLASIETLYQLTFYKSENLYFVDLPKCKSMNYGEFNLCTALKVLLLRGSTVCTASSSYIFYNTPIASGTGYIYVPSALVDSYKTATNWTTYASQFRALEDYTVDGTIDGELDETKI